MERVVVIGNCQAGALEMMLNTNEEFAARFEFVSFPPVHEMLEATVSDVHRAVAEASVVIPQRIEETYRGRMGLGTETLVQTAGSATVIRWPSLYWAGYVPDLFYLRDALGQPVLDGPFDYHDRVILQSYVAGLDVDSVCQLLEDPERPSDAKAWAAAATAELDAREQDCDVHVASFIASRFQQELLFFTMNHPTNVLLGFISQQITEALGIPGRVDHRRILDEVLGPMFYPLHANHARALQLAFAEQVVAGTTPFVIRGVTRTPLEAIGEFFHYYEQHPQLVELNLDAVAG